MSRKPKVRISGNQNKRFMGSKGRQWHTRKVCKYLNSPGGCKFGKKCRHSHEAPSTRSVPVIISTEKLLSIFFRYFKECRPPPKLNEDDEFVFHAPYMIEHPSRFDHYLSEKIQRSLESINVKISEWTVFVFSNRRKSVESCFSHVFKGERVVKSTIPPPCQAQIYVGEVSRKKVSTGLVTQSQQQGCVTIGVLTLSSKTYHSLLAATCEMSRRMSENFVRGASRGHPRLAISLYCSEEVDIELSDKFILKKGTTSRNIEYYRLEGVEKVIDETIPNHSIVQNNDDDEEEEHEGEEEKEKTIDIRKSIGRVIGYPSNSTLKYSIMYQPEKHFGYYIESGRFILRKGEYWSSKYFLPLIKSFCKKEVQVGHFKSPKGKVEHRLKFMFVKRAFKGDYFKQRSSSSTSKEMNDEYLKKGVLEFMKTEKEKTGFRHHKETTFGETEIIEPEKLMGMIASRFGGEWKLCKKDERIITVSCYKRDDNFIDPSKRRKKKQKRGSSKHGKLCRLHFGIDEETKILEFKYIHEKQCLLFWNVHSLSSSSSPFDIDTQVNRTVRFNDYTNEKYYSEVINLFDGKKLTQENLLKWMQNNDSFVCSCGSLLGYLDSNNELEKDTHEKYTMKVQLLEEVGGDAVFTFTKRRLTNIVSKEKSYSFKLEVEMPEMGDNQESFCTNFEKYFSSFVPRLVRECKDVFG